MQNDQFKTPIVDKLKELSNKNHAAFYVPGHKRGQGINPNLQDLMGNLVFKADLPELPELDNLFAPETVILEAQILAKKAFSAAQTWFLINGSTCGIVAAIVATCKPGDKIILPRNIHQSAIFGLIISGAIPIFINPEYNPLFDLSYGITSHDIQNALKLHPDVKAVMVVYPTYHGVCNDLVAIAKITQNYNIPLLVDEAHGAHFHFHQELPPSALECGADLTIQSSHKVLGALTQASMLHIQGEKIDPIAVSNALKLVQSSSPSFLLLASLDSARQQMAINGKNLLTNTINLANQAIEKISKIENLLVFKKDNFQNKFTNLDITRLTINVTELGLTGYEVDEILDQQLQVTAELPSYTGLTFIISIGNNQQDIDQLITAFSKLKKYKKNQKISLFNFTYLPKYATLKMSPREAFFHKNETILLEQSVGKISAEIICPYPPGIPILMAGEIITSEALEYLKEVNRLGATISGATDCSLKTIKILV